MLKQLQKKYLGTTIPVINVHGVINGDCTDKVAQRLSKLKTSRAVALAVSVNSPGGSPVQSDIISNKIRDFATKKNLKVYTFAKQVAASGGYYVLCTGNEVYADRTSIVGSIGVIVSKLKLQGILDMTELQMKALYSNNNALNKLFSPFTDLTQEERQDAQKMCDSLHEKFINVVKKNRGSKLKIDDKIFSGEVYDGQQAKQIGLVDDVGSMVNVLEGKYPGSILQIQEKSFFSNLRNVM